MDEALDLGCEKFTEYSAAYHKMISHSYGRVPFTFRARDFGNNLQLFGVQVSRWWNIYQPFGAIGISHSRYFLVSTFSKCHNVITVKDLFDCYLNDNIQFFIEIYPIAVGNSSRVAYHRLIKQEKNKNKDKDKDKENEKETTIMEAIIVSVAFDENTNRSKTIEDGTRKMILNKIEETKKNRPLVFKNGQIFLSQMKKAQSTLKSINGNHDSISSLYSKDYDILVHDLDLNNHANQSTISRIVDDALMQYDKEYFNGYYYMYTMYVSFINELKLTSQNGKCWVVVQKLIQNINIAQCKEYVGIVKQNGTQCAKFRFVLKLSDTNSMNQLSRQMASKL